MALIDCWGMASGWRIGFGVWLAWSVDTGRSFPAVSHLSHGLVRRDRIGGPDLDCSRTLTCADGPNGLPRMIDPRLRIRRLGVRIPSGAPLHTSERPPSNCGFSVLD